MIIKKKTVRDIPVLKGKKVFLTCDFNLSLSDGKITNDTRITEALPTINFLHSAGAKIVIASHLGRPSGVDPKYSLKPVAERLSHRTGIKVNLIPDFWKESVFPVLDRIPSHEIVLLENIRFHKGEKSNDPAFAAHLSKMADYFVNDAFGTSHRVHTSTVGIASRLPAYAGLLLDREVKVLSSILTRPKRPLVVFIGGAKTPEKIAVIEKLMDIADTVALGGAIANTFLAAWGFGMGKSLVDYEMVEMARVVFWKAARKHTALLLPEDVIASEKNTDEAKVFPYNVVPPNLCIFDIGPKTRKNYSSLISKAKTVIWNGPMGFFEDERFREGTNYLLKKIAGSKAFTVIGGGDTLTSINTESYMNKISHISTGGSAMLAFLEKGNLPGIEALQDKN